jgi:Xaa-Pro aminopeptidase
LPIAEFDTKLEELLNGASVLYYRLGVHADIDELIIRQLTRLRGLTRKKEYRAPDSIVDPATIIHEMRLFKTPEELELMQRAADIAAEAHCEAMKGVRAGMKEYEVEALIEHIFRRHGAAAPAYTSIVGAGKNATVLHYVSNSDELRDGDLLLIDAGAEYRGYASDITRTFPINGRFTRAQREIYELVLQTQVSCTEMVRSGIDVDAIKAHSIEMLTEGMVRLGLLKGEPSKLIEEGKYKQFYMHGLGHFLGLDVHDVGRYYEDGEPRKLEPGMVMTVEPGLYIAPATKDIPEQYRGIGVRIEDDVVVTNNGPRVLTNKVPKQPDEIEELMAK